MAPSSFYFSTEITHNPKPFIERPISFLLSSIKVLSWAGVYTCESSFGALSHPVTLCRRLHYFTGCLTQTGMLQTVRVHGGGDGAPGSGLCSVLGGRKTNFFPSRFSLQPCWLLVSLAILTPPWLNSFCPRFFLFCLKCFSISSVFCSFLQTWQQSCSLCHIYPIRFISVFVLLFASSIPQHQEYKLFKFTTVGCVYCLISCTLCIIYTQ